MHRDDHEHIGIGGDDTSGAKNPGKILAVIVIFLIIVLIGMIADKAGL